MRWLALSLPLVACSAPDPTPEDQLGGLDNLNGELLDEPIDLPEFAVVNYDETPRTKADLIGHPTVVWYFLASGTPGWTIEGCGYRDFYDLFQAEGVEIVGATYGKPENAANWVDNQGFQYEVWSDSDKVLGQALGAGDGGTAKRVTSIIDRQGRILVRYGEVGFRKNPTEVLDDVRRLREVLAE